MLQHKFSPFQKAEISFTFVQESGGDEVGELTKFYLDKKLIHFRVLEIIILEKRSAGMWLKKKYKGKY